MKTVYKDKIAKKRAGWALVGIIFTVINIVIFMSTVSGRFNKENIEVKDGIATINETIDINNVVYTLNGQWSVLEGVYIDCIERLELVDETKLDTYRVLPETLLKDVKEPKSYALDLNFASEKINTSRLAIAIPLPYQDTKVYLNGIELDRYNPFKSWLGTDFELQLYLMDGAYDELLDNQELIISVNAEGEDYGMYRREVMISNVSTFYEMAQVSDALQNILWGIMAISILIGFINMMIMPRHDMLTSTTLFDTSLMLYIFFASSTLPEVIINIIFPDMFGEPITRGVTLGVFYVTCYLGNRLLTDIFDSKKRFDQRFDKIVGRLWLIAAVIYLFYPQYNGDISIILTLLLFFSVFWALLQKIKLSMKHNEYNIVQEIHAIKAIYIGVILMYDILTLNTYPRNNALLIAGYSVFFFVQLLMRANVHKEAFDNIRLSKETLEDKVVERTKELEIANQNLKNIMNIDPLTKAFNRLYFEEIILKKIEQNNSSFHICLFDLDNFKRINDTYGHHIGDEQLVTAVQLASEVIVDQGIISRIGGEEFVILFENLTDEKVLLLVENIRLKFEMESIKEGRTTGSFGITKFSDTDNRKSVFIRVDECLYHSKTNGKNCITYEFGQRKIYGKD